VATAKRYVSKDDCVTSLFFLILKYSDYGVQYLGLPSVWTLSIIWYYSKSVVQRFFVGVAKRTSVTWGLLGLSILALSDILKNTIFWK
jgi:hypothetical protein